MEQITVTDIRNVQGRLSKVFSFVFPHHEDWEQTCKVELHTDDNGAYYRIGFNLPRYVRPDGDFPNDPTGRLFMGATMRLSDWDDVLLFADWMEQIQVYRLTSYK